MPPLECGCCRCSSEMGGERLSSQMKFRIIFVSALAIGFGIPWAYVRNWVIPPIVIWIISLFPSREGCVLLHSVSLVLILSMIGSHGMVSSRPFPIQAPRHRTA